MVRCRLDGGEDAASLRYVPLNEFELWRYLMQTRHHRTVVVDEVSAWMSEHAAVWNSGSISHSLRSMRSWPPRPRGNGAR